MKKSGPRAAFFAWPQRLTRLRARADSAGCLRARVPDQRLMDRRMRPFSSVSSTLDLYGLTFLEEVGHGVDALVGDLRDMQQPVLAGQHRDDGAEVGRILSTCRRDHCDTGGTSIAARPRLAAHRDILSRWVVPTTAPCSKILDFGAIVNVLPRTDGLLHISQIAHQRVNAVTDSSRKVRPYRSRCWRPTRRAACVCP